MLFDQNASGEGLNGIVVQNGNGHLEKNRPAVEVFIYKVDRATGDLYTMGQGLILGIETREGGQERRVDIQDTPLKFPNELPTEESHVACQTNPIDRVRIKQISNLRIKSHSIDAFRID